jgi:hypothetical protein
VTTALILGAFAIVLSGLAIVATEDDAGFHPDAYPVNDVARFLFGLLVAAEIVLFAIHTVSQVNQ